MSYNGNINFEVYKGQLLNGVENTIIISAAYMKIDCWFTAWANFNLSQFVEARMLFEISINDGQTYYLEPTVAYMRPIQSATNDFVYLYASNTFGSMDAIAKGHFYFKKIKIVTG